MLQQILTVTELNDNARRLLEQGIGRVQVEGEISNLSRPASGHLYFNLKDSGASVACTLFKGVQTRLKIRPAELQDGMAVLATARAGLYAPRGSYQINIEQLEPAGLGQLEAQYQALLQKLTAEGLFAQARKPPLPERPTHIGIITSPAAAALQDVLTTLRRRNPALEISLYPAPVQGAEAPPALIRALEQANRGDADVLLLVRGGGSIEDLWAFNDEQLARAVAASRIPVVSGVGHETDTTLCDFAAACRAPTPTAAAETVSPPLSHLLERLNSIERQLVRALAQQLQRQQARLSHLAHRHAQQSPQRSLEQKIQRLDELAARLHALPARLHARAAERAVALAGRLERQNPARQLALQQERCLGLQKRLHTAAERQQEAGRQRLAGLAQQLELLSPLSILARGYAIAQTPDGAVLRRAADAAINAPLNLKLLDGIVRCTVCGTTHNT